MSRILSADAYIRFSLLFKLRQRRMLAKFVYSESVKQFYFVQLNILHYLIKNLILKSFV